MFLFLQSVVCFFSIVFVIFCNFSWARVVHLGDCFFVCKIFFPQGYFFCLLQGVVFLFNGFVFERFFLGQGFCVFLQWVFCFCVARCIVSAYVCDDFFVFFFAGVFSCSGYCVFLLEGVLRLFFCMFFFFFVYFCAGRCDFFCKWFCFFFFGQGFCVSSCFWFCVISFLTLGFALFFLRVLFF